MKREVTIQLAESMEATPIAKLVQIANRFDSSVYLEINAKKVNAKSIMGMMSMVLSNGSTVTIDAEGDDCEQALLELSNFLAS